VIATKLGILPPKRNLVLDFAKPIARQVFKVFSSLRMRSATQFVQSQVVRHATSRTATGQFDPVTAKKSLDTSLKELKTDYVDILFLHCCTLDDVRGGEIFDFLRNSVSAGKVRYLGLSTDLDNTNQIMAVFPDVQVVNLARNLVADDINRLEQKDQVAVVTYAPLGGGLFNDSITRMVREQRNELGKWSQMTGLDLRESAAWSRLFLRYAYESNPAGVVVCGMHSKAHIINNIDATASEPAGSPRFFTAAAEIRRVLAHGA
jgi:aryl-alcohol dehydrogenase-like predicted oxidoreductase